MQFECKLDAVISIDYCKSLMQFECKLDAVISIDYQNNQANQI